MSCAWAPQAEYPLPYWPGVVVFHAIYAIFEVKRFENFQKYGEVRAAASLALCPPSRSPTPCMCWTACSGKATTAGKRVMLTGMLTKDLGACAADRPPGLRPLRKPLFH